MTGISITKHAGNMAKTAVCWKNNGEYERFIASSQSGSFTQSRSWAWIKNGWDSDIVITRNQDGTIAGAAQLLFYKLPCTGLTFAYAPRGPVCDFNSLAAFNDIMQEMIICAQKHHAFSLKIDPLLAYTNQPAQRLLKELGFLRNESGRTVQCSDYFIRSLEGMNEESLFESFHKKWRYNIRLAQRRGVVCVNGGLPALEDFYRLMQETGKRDGFQIRSIEYFRRMLTLLDEDTCRLYMCYREGIPLSGAIAIHFGHSVSYVYGASGNEGRENMPNYLMQWTMMQWALRSGCAFYDFQGVPHYDNPSHPNYGVYRFKQGFGGNVVTFAGEFDKILMPRIYKAVHILTGQKI